MPVLHDHYGAVLESGELKLAFQQDRGAFDIAYRNHRFPVDPKEYPRILGLCADCLLYTSFGAAFGLATRRHAPRSWLSERPILEAFCLALAFTFALAGVGKGFSMLAMTDFFTQSGYSVAFLKFIVIAEIFGAMGLLLPWARIPAWFGLTIDMFGAVTTHIHNGDPLNDSTGAIGMLIRLILAAILFELQRGQPQRPERAFRAVFRAALGTVLCLFIAIPGAMAMRLHRASTPNTGQTSTK